MIDLEVVERNIKRAQTLYHRAGLKNRPNIKTHKSPLLSSPQIMYYFSIEFLELAVSCLGLGEGGCDCTALAIY